MSPVTAISMLSGAFCCGWIAWQDFRTREIHIIPLIGFTLSGLAFHYKMEGVRGIIDSGFSLLLLGLVIGATWLWFRLKRGGSFFDVALGWGDVWILAALACWLNPPEFLLLYICGTMCVLTATIIYSKATQKTVAEVPLAGGFAVAAFLFLPLNYVL